MLRSSDRCSPVRLPDAWKRPGLEAELLAPCLAVPVCSDSLGAIAIVLFGPHQNGNDIDPDEREMLSEVATRAAGGYERAAFVLLNGEVSQLRASLAALKPATCWELRRRTPTERKRARARAHLTPATAA